MQASELSTDIISLPSFLHSATIFLQVAYSLESGRARPQVRPHVPRWKIRRNWRTRHDSNV